MPDLMNPDWNDGKLTHIVWKDEICISCLNKGSCPLISLIYTHEILSSSGIHVASCKLYGPDKTSEFYNPDPDDMTQQQKVNEAALMQQIDLLTGLLGNVAEAAKGMEGSDVSP